jgi:nucleotide-binding universal stress UspA family protein
MLGVLFMLAPGIVFWLAVVGIIVGIRRVCHADLLSGAGMGLVRTHRRTGLTRWAVGSVVDRVLRACRAPILLVRAR